VPVTVALLRGLGANRGAGVDETALARLATTPVTGGERVVGEIRATLPRSEGAP